jgi:DNA-directed RNA polymerase specialized sigma24 family protein
LTPAESHPEKPNRDSSSRPSDVRVTQGKWSLTREAFDNLLTAFSTDRNEAATEYERIRVKLIRFFEWRACDSPEERTDQTINRVARKIHEGQPIDNLIGFFYGVARLVFMESLKERERAPLPLETIETIRLDESLEDDEGPELRLRCLDRCLEKLAPESRSLILEYYQEEKRLKIEIRKQLADRLRIPLNALRIRAHRIRTDLEKCVTGCLEQPS